LEREVVCVDLKVVLGLLVVVIPRAEPDIPVEWLRGDKSFFLMGSETWAKG